ncbi:hypothetical protein TTHERM_00050580 (macronuclear) [Tetrahymena thermophila SB210]|uniref:Uncharacterized protein n=1 Tax=Tetrahymena thermophila (strain SB210) TaxID=312017 RepID=Q23D32_TETTS|nr:hypothetical protein TTHERM_00050580 [Tetrahymena thermophila SB210]EAR94462.2 hypothetical protein TTHERM_00050580 [Tetrahymena thermophila SB210]|eukprot:XP_001014854.2 hypothetical protein TTHERM_00050580 [Tetrahymena thermophila SB210]
MSNQNLDCQLICNEHHNQAINFIDIGNYSSKKLLCSKCMKQNRYVDELDVIPFSKFQQCMKIIENDFWDLSDSQFSKDEVLQAFNGRNLEEKLNLMSKEENLLSQQFRAKIYGQIQEAYDQFIKSLQEQINNFRYELQENLKNMLSVFIQNKLKSTDQSKIATIIVQKIDESKSYSEIEELIKQLHSGKLELKFILDDLNTTQAQIQQTLQQLLDNQKKVFENSKNSLNSILPPTKTDSKSEPKLENFLRSNIINSCNLNNTHESPLKFMRLNQLKLQGNCGSSSLNGSLNNTKLISPISPQKIANQYQTPQNYINSSTLSLNNNQKQSIATNNKVNTQQRQFFKERFINSLNTLNTICEKKINNQQIISPRAKNNDSLSRIPQDLDSLSEIRNHTSSNLSSLNDQSENSLQINKLSARGHSENKVNKDEKRALIDSLYYTSNYNNTTAHEGQGLKLNDTNKNDKYSSLQCSRPKQNLQPLTIQSQPNLLGHNHTNSLIHLASPVKKQEQAQSKSEQSSPQSNYTICKSKISQDNVTCALKMKNDIIVTGTQDGYILACEVSQPLSEDQETQDIIFKQKVRAHRYVTHLTQCPSNNDMFFSVGQFKENSSSIKLWNLGNNCHITEVAELRDFHPAPIDQIIVLKEELTKDVAPINKNSKDQKEEEINEDRTAAVKPLVTVITLATFSKSDSLKIWNITYRNGTLQNGVVQKIIDISLKNLSIQSHLLRIEDQLYISNANRIYGYSFNEDYSVIKKEIQVDLFIEKSDFIQFLSNSNNLICAFSKQQQVVVLDNELKLKKPAANLIKLLIQHNNKLEPEKIFFNNLIALNHDHFGFGFKYDKNSYKVAILNGATCKAKAIIESFENPISFAFGMSSDNKILLIEANKVIKIQKSWVNNNKINISFKNN